MNATVHAVRITGHGVDRLHLAAGWATAQRALARIGSEVLVDRFDGAYPFSDDPIVVGQRLAAEGYRVTVSEQEVEL